MKSVNIALNQADLFHQLFEQAVLLVLAQALRQVEYFLFSHTEDQYLIIFIQERVIVMVKYFEEVFRRGYLEVVINELAILLKDVTELVNVQYSLWEEVGLSQICP